MSSTCETAGSGCHQHAPTVGRRLLLTLGVTTGVAALTSIGGVLAGSLALLADGLHMLLDSAALLISFFALRVARRPPSLLYPWGYAGAELFGALINAVLLVLLGLGIAREALERAQAHEPVDARAMVITATIGLIANGLCLKLLHNHGHNLTLRGAFLHVVGDVANSVGVLVSALLLAYTGNPRLDCYASLLVAAIVVGTSVPLWLSVGQHMLQKHPNPGLGQATERTLRALPGVLDVVSLRPVFVGGQQLAVFARLRCTPSCDHAELLPLARAAIQKAFKPQHLAVELDGSAEAKLC